MNFRNTSFKIIFISGVTLVLGFLLSCEKETSVRKFSESAGVFILNEGNFTYGNASLSFYNPALKKITNHVFFNANAFPVGDVLQSMAIIDTIGFLVVNNSGKVMVINTNTFKHLKTITGFMSPRYFLPINTKKAYVSDLYNTALSVVDLETYTITGTIPLKKTSEQMIRFGNYVFVTNWSKQNTIQRVNTLNDQLVDSLVVTKQPNSMVIDKNNKLWVLCDGGFVGITGGKVRAALIRVNPESFTKELEISFPDNNSYPTHLSINGTKDTLVFLNGSWGQTVSNGGVYKMAVSATSLPTQPLIAENKRLFYGLGIDPENSEIYVTNAVDYQQPGWVFRYSASGTPVDSFKTDIIPSAFCFKHE